MLEKIKNIFSDNYKLLSLITTVYAIFLYLFNLMNLNISRYYSLFYSFQTPFYGYRNDTGMIVFTWLVFIFSIWTIVKLFKTQPKSSLILFFMFLAIYLNPLYRIEIRSDVCLFVITTINTFIITVYNWQILKVFGCIIKTSFTKFAKLFKNEN